MRRKHAFPAMFFIINERLCSPPYGTLFCAAPFLSPHPAPSFPPSPFPQPVNQWSWLSPDGRQAVSHQQWKRGLILCLSLLLFMPPCLLKFFHLMVSVASLGPPHTPHTQLSAFPTVPVQFVFSPVEVAAVAGICPKKGKLLQTWLLWCHKARLSWPWGGRPGIINK